MMTRRTRIMKRMRRKVKKEEVKEMEIVFWSL
jgi:hypothetical protein